MAILIVDDVEENLRVLEAFLSRAGHKDIPKASSAREAYQLLEEHESIDLILLDIMMPEISGIDACRKIKADERLKDIPVIMVTARDDMESLEAAFSAGAMDYVVKPLRKIELLARVNSAIRLKREMDERKKREHDLEEQKNALQAALNEIKVLRGFLPICAHCKKIRDVQGFWHQLEAYIMSHADVRFSHGICESCLETHYPSDEPSQDPPATPSTQ